MQAQASKIQAAQNQHFVPKFILRNFLQNPNKDRVNVFSKSTSRTFQTSVKNIMAERRFHEFRIDDGYIASFEDSICRVEDNLLPTYRALVERRKFDGSAEEKVLLAIFIAFQFLRTRSQRDMYSSLNDGIAKWIVASSYDNEKVKGLGAFTADDLTKQHMFHIQGGIEKLTNILSSKDFLLASAPPGRSFYLSDSPVCLHNETQKIGPYSNMGLASPGIQIYLPLSANLLLCLWCPSLREKMEHVQAQEKRNLSSVILSPRFLSFADSRLLDEQLQKINKQRLDIEGRLDHFHSGSPIPYNSENMDFNNSIQVGQAKEHLICKNSDFELARRHIKDFGSGQALSLTVS